MKTRVVTTDGVECDAIPRMKEISRAKYIMEYEPLYHIISVANYTRRKEIEWLAQKENAENNNIYTYYHETK